MNRSIKCVAASAAIALSFTSCTGTGELETLQAENAVLQSQLAEAQTKISELEEKLQTTVSEESDTITTTEEVTAVLSPEEVQSYISIGAAIIDDINSAGGVDVDIYWRNNSDKDIKYIRFTMEFINAVDDIVADDITNHTSFIGKATGPVSPTTMTIEEKKNIPERFTGFYYKAGEKWESVISNQQASGFFYRDDNYNEVVINESEEDKFMIKYSWEAIMYNSTARRINISQIDIEYMDGTKLTLSQEEVIGAYL